MSRATPLSRLIFNYEAETYILRSAAIRIQDNIPDVCKRFDAVSDKFIKGIALTSHEFCLRSS